MAKLAIFIDGGYSAKVAEPFGIRFDYRKLSARIAEAMELPPGSYLLRTYYYDATPYQGNPPTDEEKRRVAEARRFFDRLRKLPNFDVRLGRVTRNQRPDGGWVYQQKGVDLYIGIDIAKLALRQSITHAAVFSGDSDLLPAIELAKEEAVQVWHIHGADKTYARALWQVADNRLAINEDFARSVARPPRRPGRAPVRSTLGDVLNAEMRTALDEAVARSGSGTRREV